MYEHPINKETLFYALDEKSAVEYLKQTNFRWCAKVNELKDGRYEATTHPLFIDHNYQDDDGMIKSIMPTDFEPLEYKLMAQRLKELETLVTDIKEVIGCNYVQLENKSLLTNYLTKNGFTKQDESVL